MKIIVLGGDGFVGWPTALHLSKNGNDVLIIDNFIHRQIDQELDICSLTPIAEPQVRCEVWRQISGNALMLACVDIARDYQGLCRVLRSWRPDAVVHFAEQRSAPYSMKSPVNKRYTVNNNIQATHNLLCALVDLELNAHVVHLGTMGVYGYGTAGCIIPEGYLTVQINAENNTPVSREILYPTDPGSIYHMTKCMDQALFAYYAKNDSLRITDLHQGIVWGTNTVDTLLDERLINRFDYDGDYGTVLNRFLVQATLNYPLTVHGNGGQTRAFIHISDTVRCIELALKNPPCMGERVKIFNQMTETHRVIDLANMISQMTGVPIHHTINPRNEAPENELKVNNDQFLALGLNPVTLAQDLMVEVVNITRRYQHRINKKYIPCTSGWTREIAARLAMTAD